MTNPSIRQLRSYESRFRMVATRLSKLRDPLSQEGSRLEIQIGGLLRRAVLANLLDVPERVCIEAEYREPHHQPYHPDMRFWRAVVDVWIVPDNPTVFPQPYGLSHFSNIGLSEAQCRDMVEGRHWTSADAVEVLADHLERRALALSQLKKRELLSQLNGLLDLTRLLRDAPPLQRTGIRKQRLGEWRRYCETLRRDIQKGPHSETCEDLVHILSAAYEQSEVNPSEALRFAAEAIAEELDTLPLAVLQAESPRQSKVPAELLARLEAAAAAIPAVLEGNRAGFQRVAGMIESLGARDDDKTSAAQLPKLKAHDRQAWNLWNLAGKDQDEVADLLNAEHGTTYKQAQVSRMCNRFQTYIKVGGLAEKLPKRADRERSVDPARLDLGARIDKRKPRPSDMTRANDDDE